MADDGILDVLIIGAGFSGVCAAIKLKQAGIKDFRIYDKAGGIGGTWWNNTYPGAACDIPSHFYCFSFEPNANWSRLYSPQEEIQAYIEYCVDKYGLRSHLNLRREIVSLTFDDASGTWTTLMKDGERVRSRFVINGSGALHKPSTPAFKGAERYSGISMHTAEWDKSFEPSDKTIAVIGSAASAIQVIPAIAEQAKHICLYQRTPNYILPRNDFAYSETWKKRFRRFPLLARLHRLMIFYYLELKVFPVITRSAYRAKRAEDAKRYIKVMTRGRRVREKMVPDYEMGCKRILISDDFFDALNRDNVELVSEPIGEITEKGIVSASEERLFDAIIYATGFDLEGHMLGIEVTGEQGQTLKEAWENGAQAYKGVMIPGFPNYFLTTGPNTGVGTTSVVFMIEQTIGWIMKCLRKAGRDRIVSVTEEASEAYNRDLQADFPDTVWTSGCQSWYRNAEGRMEILYPHDARTFRRQMKRIDPRHIKMRRAAKTATPQRQAAQ
ncbi:flavin-containing monooxygenase [Hoeflea prorocentri]|uniref:NAD(P)/FAD-dependent oxidoreductase n=1 Tax=Hoeflea prorocentri TaxID=1922333 RepID=A0A9X3ZJF1_9HYPH|nr:NAD(P)/FAD-dependent oxidoreductase [Hoeflea prorocentri]MCY6382725.1 NAD(P)/FAD-dependent oxidoreductase [Hoeflea prorocentri]MDA5400525.1 NAD(P)/FAD-dependent oxidoreductase [Hoeflea prorocentri]